MTCRNTSIIPEEDLHFQQSGPQRILSWLPPYILNDVIQTCPDDSAEDDFYRLFSKRQSVVNGGLEACGEDDDRRFDYTERNYNYKHRHQPPPAVSGRKSPVAAGQPPLLTSPPDWKNYSKTDQKTKYPSNWASGGPGMQAVFLVSGQKSCGTGVFLPRTAGTEAEKPKKPAFAPILLPSRVVQALNLNVHGLGSQIKPREQNNNVKGLECDQIRTKKNKDMSSQTCVISQNRSSSPEIFLPKEWTY